MRRRLATLCVAVLASVTTPPWATGAPPAEDTRVTGTAPALEGRWLLLTTLDAGGRRSAASLWEVTTTAGGVVLHEPLVELPPRQRAALGRGGWEPTPADLEAIAAGWSSLAPTARGLTRLRHELIGPDAFDEAVKREPMAAGALWIVRQTYAFAPAGSRPAQEIRVFAASTHDDRGYGGRWATATVALAPMPLPIKLDGTFRLLRLPAVERSLWRRLTDAVLGDH